MSCFAVVRKSLSKTYPKNVNDVDQELGGGEQTSGKERNCKSLGVYQGGGERGGMVMNQIETCIIIMTCYIQSTLTPLMISFISLIRKSFAAICFT